MNSLNLSSLVSLEAYEKCLNIALRAGHIGVWDWHIPEDRIEWSERVYETHGIARGAFKGTFESYCELIHPEDRHRVTLAVEEAVEACKHYGEEFRIVRPSGETRWIAATAELVLDEMGNPWRLTGATVDITERKQREAALLLANEELERFAYAASHDLQEPLRTVTNFTQLLAREVKGRLDDDCAQYVDFILDATRRMRALIDSLLALSRAGAAPGAPLQPLDSGAIVAACIETLRIAINETGAVIDCHKLPEVMGESTQLEQLFQNLLSNAIKYGKPGVPPRVEIAATPHGSEWEFCVRDCGQGFDQSKAEDLFTPFRRLHGREIPGTGIGLAICRRIVERHGGRIWVEAIPGEGASFFFTLPSSKKATSPPPLMA